MSNYPSHETYKALYAKYHQGRGIDELLDLAEPLRGMHVLELCGGDGRMSLAAIERGAEKVVLTDKEKEMFPSLLEERPRIKVRVRDAENTLNDFRFWKWTFDRIICRQAVNYWLYHRTAEVLPEVLNEGGIFAFNTFNQEPPREPMVKTYEYQGHHFVEVSWLVGDMVHHVQVREGMEPHCTSFRWISPEEFRTLLEPPVLNRGAPGRYNEPLQVRQEVAPNTPRGQAARDFLLLHWAYGLAAFCRGFRCGDTDVFGALHAAHRAGVPRVYCRGALGAGREQPALDIHQCAGICSRILACLYITRLFCRDAGRAFGALANGFGPRRRRDHHTLRAHHARGVQYPRPLRRASHAFAQVARARAPESLVFGRGAFCPGLEPMHRAHIGVRAL